MGGTSLVVSIKNMPYYLLEHTNAVVCDQYADFPLVFGHGYGDFSILRSKLDGVVQKIQPNMAYYFFITIISESWQVGEKTMRLSSHLLDRKISQRSICSSSA